MKVVNIEIDRQVAVITIQNGKVNAISRQVVEELHAALDQAERNKAVVVLTGQTGMFSGGYDLATINSGIDEAVELVTAGSKLARRMLAFSFPIIAACSGHAIAKGAFLLLSCDYRIGCTGDFKIGLNEVAIGMTMHHAGIEIARGRIPVNFLNRAVINGEIFSPQTAVSAGFIDTIVEPESLITSAHATARQLRQIDMKAHQRTKLRERLHLLKSIDNAIELDLEEKNS